MDTRCLLRTLGLPALFGPAGEAIRFRVKKHLAVLVYLGVEPRVPLRREFLADLLWPTATAGEGRHSLATALSVLRTRLGRAALETTRDVVRLTGAGLLVDLERLASGDVLGDEVRAPLEVGGFLDGFEVPDADEFMRWKERQQARLLPAILEAMVMLIDRCRRTADSRQMERIADRMIGLDPLSEDAIRAKMEARAFAGDRVTALRVFEEWKEQLARELGAAPSTTVDGLASRLRRRGWERTDGPPVPPIATEQWRNRPFIGRMPEYRVLYEQWERVRNGEPGHVLVRGDSGIGKTTIVERLSTAAALEGAGASRVQCYELEREIPYAAVTGLVVGLLEKPGASAAPPDALAELSRTVPEVRQRFPAIPPSVDSQGETARIRLTEALHDLTSAIADEHPVILIVDDLHLADDASLAVLHLLIRRAVGQPIMLVLTVRPGELGRSPQALRLLESATSLGFREVELSPLSEAEASEFLDSVVPPGEPRPGAAARRALLAAGAGYPMVLELLVSDWHRNGERSLALSLGAMTADLHSGDRAQAGSYDAVFERILQSLDPTARAVLNLAAILGHRMNSLPMYGIVELGLGQAMHGLSELAKLRVLRDAGQRLEFLNELIRACAYRAVPSPVRRELHSAVADWLIEGKAEQQANGLEKAWHCTRAGRWPEAVPYLLSGANEASSSGAPHEAERALESALDRLHGTARQRAIVLLVEALQEQGRWLESLNALDSLEAASDTIEPAHVQVLKILARRNLEAITASDGAADAAQLCRIIESEVSTATKLIAATALASVCGNVRLPAVAGNALAAVLKLDDSALSIEDRVRIRLTRSVLAYHAGDAELSATEIRLAAELLPETGWSNSLAARIHTGLASHALIRGDYDEALRHNTTAHDIVAKSGDAFRRARCLANIALCHGRLGHLPEQIECAELALRLAGPQFSGYTHLQASYWLALGQARTGRRETSFDTIARLEHTLPANAPGWAHQIWHLYKADVLSELGHPREASKAARETISFEDPIQIPPQFEGLWARWLAVAAHNDDELRAALKVLVGLRKRVERLALLDRAEVLWSLIAVAGKLGISCEEEGSELRSTLALLPPPTSAQMSRLRLPSTSDWASGGPE